ncbi:DUF2200 domain-containing protein [Roseivirga sp. E12]|uniref:DUF2200 domain-containing protein n=1 Tax=Roseivirga sp. E12 TaxID=2819237 RepID=UPI001ABCB1A9|nr:DUF2200 domain-containing protein [Roseivirga sp. E12]MBO3698084.1 DUF2200 domain-containing protein [Roseivirga sp. E12]
MKTTPEHNERVRTMIFSSFYPHYVNRIEKNGRTEEELRQVLEWLTGFDSNKLQQLIDDRVTVEEFFQEANIHPNAHLIKGVICGYRIEEIDNSLTRQARYMDKLVDELAKGRKMEKIMR